MLVGLYDLSFNSVIFIDFMSLSLNEAKEIFLYFSRLFCMM